MSVPADDQVGQLVAVLVVPAGVIVALAAAAIWWLRSRHKDPPK